MGDQLSVPTKPGAELAPAPISYPECTYRREVQQGNNQRMREMFQSHRPAIDVRRLEELVDTAPQPWMAEKTFGWTPLHWASQVEAVEAVRLFLRKGHPVDVRDHYGRTPLHLAAYYGSIEAVKLLLVAGAHPRALTHDFSRSPRELGLCGLASSYGRTAYPRIKEILLAAEKGILPDPGPLTPSLPSSSTDPHSSAAGAKFEQRQTRARAFSQAQASARAQQSQHSQHSQIQASAPLFPTETLSASAPSLTSIEASASASALPRGCECPVCIYPFDASERVPLILSACGHSLCSVCVAGMQQAAPGSAVLKCPSCRAETKLKPHKPLPKNYALLESIDGLVGSSTSLVILPSAVASSSTPPP